MRFLSTWQHDLAALTLENQTLRQRLGMKGFEDVKKVMFQSSGTSSRRNSHSSQPSQASAPSSRRCWVESDDTVVKSPSGHGHGRKLSVSSRKDKIGGKDGSWQVFMAWVPTGTALIQAESWKPSEKEAGGHTQKVLMSRKKPRPLSNASGASGASGGECLSVVPHETEKITLAVDGEDSDSDSSGSSRMDHKQQYTVLPVWEASERLQKKLRKNSRSEAASSAAYKEDEPDFGAETPPWYILNPDTSPRVYWDILSLVMITYDIIFVPLEVCFTLEETNFLAFLDWFTRLFWTFDMVASCLTGFVFSDGVIEYKLSAILRRYAKTWFVPDLSMVLSDWIGYLVAGSGLGLGQLARAIRTARAVRLLRLLRMQEVLANLTERLQSDVIEIVMQIVKLVILLVMLCHFMACFWWAVGTNGDGTSWVKAGAFDDLSADASYLVCLLWAMSLFSGGCNNIYPETSTERMYGVAACLCSFVFLLVMLGTLTSGLTQRHIIDGSGQRQMAALKTYSRQNSIPKNLTKRLCRSAKHAISGDLTPDSVQLLAVISEPLKMQMHFEMYSRLLLYQPFFKDLLTEGNQLVRRICHQAMGILLLAHGDVVFEVEEEPSEPKLYLVASGALDYTDSYGEVEKVYDKCWIAEPVLWTRWKHRGTLVAISDVKMAMLDATSFQEICRQAISKKNPACLPIIAYALES